MRKINSNHTVICMVLLILAFLANTNAMAATTVLHNSVTSVANRLQSSQLGTGAEPGIWPGEADFTGAIVAGLVDAYKINNLYKYREAAELGGYYILTKADIALSISGDEAYALAQLSSIQENPNDNMFRTALKYFYFYVDTDTPNGLFGTKAYIDRFVGTDPSTAVFYLAHHVVAAYYVDFYDKEIWRQGLIDWLSHVSDSNSVYPVISMGTALWALAETSPLNESIPISFTKQVPYWDTLIDPSGKGAPYWTGKKLIDLPTMLMSHQVPAGQLNAGSFYWRFAHGVNDPNSGYTEDAVFATIGLANVVDAAKVAKATPKYFNPAIFGSVYLDPNMFSPGQDAAVSTARGALLNGISA